MKIALRDQPPANVLEFVKLTETDLPDQFITNLVDLLKSRANDIETDPVPIGWVETAIEQAPGGYGVSMMRVAVNSGDELGAGFGRFFFELLPAN